MRAGIKTQRLIIHPEDVGLETAIADDVRGGTAEENAISFAASSRAHADPQRDVVLLNAAAALFAAEIVSSCAKACPTPLKR